MNHLRRIRAPHPIPNKARGLVFFGALLLCGGTALAAEPALTLEQAIHEAVARAPSSLAASAAVNTADAEARQVDGSLRPQIDLAASQSRATSNLAAQGLRFPGLDPFVGPFSTFDARVELSQVIFDWSRVLQSRGARLAIDVARAQAALAREQAAARAAIAYINVLGSEQGLEAGKANLALSEDLYRLAVDQRDAGVASGIDVARAATAVSQNRFRVSEADTALQTARLNLRRAIALPSTRTMNLVGRLQRQQVIVPQPEQALSVARRSRPDLLVIAAQLDQLDQSLAAAKSERLPKLVAFADYGYSGSTPVQNEERTYRYGASVQVPILTGGTIGAATDAALSRITEARLRADDLNAQVEEDVLTALVQVRNRAEQVDAAASTRALAERELTLARDRFSQGVADNIEVVSAQTSLTEARAGYVQALASFQQARVNLAAALGQAESFSLDQGVVAQPAAAKANVDSQGDADAQATDHG